MLVKALCVLILTLLFNPVYGHDTVGSHGGRVADAGDLHVELVAKGDVIEVYLTDHADTAVPATGYKGVAILVIEGKSQRIALEPSGQAVLSGKAAGALPKAPRGVIQLTPPKGKTVQGRFN